MKIKILTTEFDQQLILKPETEFEKKVCKMFEGLPNVYRGDFDRTKAGYNRNFSVNTTDGDDLIIRFPNSEEVKSNLSNK